MVSEGQSFRYTIRSLSLALLNTAELPPSLSHRLERGMFSVEAAAAQRTRLTFRQYSRACHRLRSSLRRKSSLVCVIVSVVFSFFLPYVFLFVCFLYNFFTLFFFQLFFIFQIFWTKYFCCCPACDLSSPAGYRHGLEARETVVDHQYSVRRSTSR